jgi:hypothetical protein
VKQVTANLGMRTDVLYCPLSVFSISKGSSGSSSSVGHSESEEEQNIFIKSIHETWYYSGSNYNEIGLDMICTLKPLLSGLMTGCRWPDNIKSRIIEDDPYVRLSGIFF